MEEFRKCKGCGIEKPLEQFYVARVKNGVEYRRHQCNECHYQKGHSRDIEIAEWLEGIKKTKSCQDCGNDDFRVLEFHHRGDKKFNVGDSVRLGLAKAKILAEIAKCDILCANCHRIETYEARRQSA